MLVRSKTERLFFEIHGCEGRIFPDLNIADAILVRVCFRTRTEDYSRYVLIKTHVKSGTTVNLRCLLIFIQQDP